MNFLIFCLTFLRASGLVGNSRPFQTAYLQSRRQAATLPIFQITTYLILDLSPLHINQTLSKLVTVIKFDVEILTRCASFVYHYHTFHLK